MSKYFQRQLFQHLEDFHMPDNVCWSVLKGSRPCDFPPSQPLYFHYQQGGFHEIGFRGAIRLQLGAMATQIGPFSLLPLRVGDDIHFELRYEYRSRFR